MVDSVRRALSTTCSSNVVPETIVLRRLGSNQNIDCPGLLTLVAERIGNDLLCCSELLAIGNSSPSPGCSPRSLANTLRLADKVVNSALEERQKNFGSPAHKKFVSQALSCTLNSFRLCA